ncbi:SURF1 family cytochrome oxidase biogenesis protein [Dietzia sp.]|uniref:SURF1 family cytochrome oxidase biogenesis protein n=1 Tax=Dietzia sp. TaxID=1871616 RepID=UPI002FD8BA07
MNLRRFLTPGWILGLLAVIAFAWACFSYLAPWQLGKNDDLNARNDNLVAASETPPVPVAEALGATDPSSYDWHYVSLKGHYLTDPERALLLRLRTVDGDPTFQSLVPFQVDGGPTVLTNRGSVPVGPGSSVPDIAAPPAGEVEIEARFRMAESGDVEPADVEGVPTAKNIDPSSIEALPQLSGVDLAPQFVIVQQGQPGALGPVPAPGLEDGPYLSYGLQWLAFGIIAPLALIYFVTAELRNRRKRGILSVSRSSGSPLLLGTRAGAPATPSAETSSPGEGNARAGDDTPAGDTDQVAGADASATGTDSAAPGEPGSDAENADGSQQGEPASPPSEASRQNAASSRYGDTRTTAEKRRARRNRSRI